MNGAAFDLLPKLRDVRLEGNICVDDDFKNQTQIASLCRVVTAKCGFNETVSTEFFSSSSSSPEISSTPEPKSTEKNCCKIDLKTFEESYEKVHHEAFNTFANQTIAEIESCLQENSKNSATINRLEFDLKSAKLEFNEEVKHLQIQNTKNLIKIGRHEATFESMKSQIEDLRNLVKHLQNDVAELQGQVQSLNIKDERQKMTKR